MIATFIHGFFIGSSLALVSLALLMIGWIIADAIKDFPDFHEDSLPNDQKADASTHDDWD